LVFEPIGCKIEIMSTRSFDDFVKQQRDSAVPFDWEAEKNEWLRQLEVLYRSVSDYLQPYVEKGEIKIGHVDATLTEEDIGSYPAKELTIKIGRGDVLLKPVGTRIFGAKGRVDIIGPRGRAQLILVDRKASSTSDLIHVTVAIEGQAAKSPSAPAPKESIEFTWKFFTPPPQRRLLELNKDLFLQLLMETVNG
jgi:hypothetical protein